MKRIFDYHFIHLILRMKQKAENEKKFADQSIQTVH